MDTLIRPLCCGWLLLMLSACSAAGTSAEPVRHDKEASTGPSRAEAAPGQALFEVETFGGNGRSCATCHRAGSRQLGPAQVQALFAENPGDPLFQTDASDDFGEPGARENSFARIREHATIRVGLDLADGIRLLSNPETRRIFVNRSVPTTLNMALEEVLMWDGRAPSLQAQARDALVGHAEVADPAVADLDAIAAFESTEFSGPVLRRFAQGGDEPALPVPQTVAERRAFRMFEERLSDDDPLVGFCRRCHSGPMLNRVSDHIPPGRLLGTFIAAFPGDRFASALVSETNDIRNAVMLFEVIDANGDRHQLPSPDPGLAVISGRYEDFNSFKIPTLWGSADTAPYFHDNSAKTLEELVEHYGTAVAATFFTAMSPQDQADLVAYLRRFSITRTRR